MDKDYIDSEKYAYQLKELPYITNEHRYSQTSYDRTGGNKDYNNELYRDERGERVIFDALGPGCIYKVFLPTTGTDQAWLKYYFDYEETPRIEGTIKEIFGEESRYFNQEFIDINVAPDSGIVSYVPVAFSKRLKITASDPKMGEEIFYHHFDYTMYPPDRQITSWTRNTNWNTMRNEFIKCGDPINQLENQRIVEFELEAEKQINICQIECNNAQIKSFTLNLDKFNEKDENFKDLKDLILNITFDNQEEPQIYASLANIFAFPDYGIDPNSQMSKTDKYNKMKEEGNTYRTHALCTGLDKEGKFYFKLPMPFYHTASIKIENQSKKSFKGIVTLEIDTFDTQRSFGYLYITQKTFEIDRDDKEDIHYLNLEGSGNLVGIVANMDSDQPVDESAYLEGDEHIYVNQSRTPQINGTGTEDFYNGAYYWYNGTHSMPTYGCSYNAKWMRGKVQCPIEVDGTYKSAAYRFMIGDKIPFHSGIKFDMEHGFVNDCYEKGLVALFYYFTPNICYAVTDTLRLSDTEDVKRHNYESILSDTVTCTSTFEGLVTKHTKGLETYTGEIIDFKGAAQFEAIIDENAESIVIRRCFEYAFKNQCVSVYIDNEYAGEWYDPGYNSAMRLRESEFIIPSRLTKGKNKILIQLSVKSPVWTVFEYQINTLKLDL